MLTVRATRTYRGPNRFTRMPAIHLELDIGDLEDRPTNLIPGFVNRLVSTLPSLHHHECTRHEPGGFISRLREGTWMGHVLQHVALELQTLAGHDVNRGRTVGRAERGVYDVVYAYKNEEVGQAAGALAIRLLDHLLDDLETDFDFAAELETNVIRLAEDVGYGPSTAAIVDEAERRGIPVLRLDPRKSLVQLGQGCFQQRIWATITSRTSNVAVELAGDKALTVRLLQNVGIPTTRSRTVETVDEALEAAREIGFPVVLKPLDGNHGRGVCLDLRSEQEVGDHFPRAASEGRSGLIVVEHFVTGKDYRVLVIDREVVAVAERRPAHVVGDGHLTVRELIEQENSNPLRGIGHEKPLTRIAVDSHTRHVLERQGLSLDAVPAAGQEVPLKGTANMSTGGTSIDRTDDIHPENVRIARHAVMTLGLDVAGIDITCPDIAQPIRETGGAIVEINAAPGFRMHTSPTEGKPRDPGQAVIDLLFPIGTPSRIPVIAVTGTNGKTTTSRMIASILAQDGRTVGLTTTDGIYVDGEQIAAGDMAGPSSAQMVLQNPVVDCAVLECARGGILRAGLGFDRCNVGVVTNVASDHLGLGGIASIEELARVKAVVPQSVFRDGVSVLNADNTWTVEMARTARGEIIFFSMDARNPVILDHLRERGRAVVLRDEQDGPVIVLAEREQTTPVLATAEIPATHNGFVQVNIANALAATAAAIGQGISLTTIANALRGFTSSYSQTPGRFNLMRIHGRDVLLDYCHNVPGLEVVADVVRRFNAPFTTGVISMPGDRSDADMHAFASLAARTFDRLVIREDGDTRGRKPGAIAALLEQAALGTGMLPDRITVVLDEPRAAITGIEISCPGDLVVVMADDCPGVWSALECLAHREPRHGQPPRLPVLDPPIAVRLAEVQRAVQSPVTPQGGDPLSTAATT